MNDDLKKRFDAHSLDEKAYCKSQNIRDAIKNAADTIDIYVPESREKSLALTKLEESCFWANAGLSRN